ncbi:MAG: ABC transporter permease [Alteromonadaceae bacterium]|nr:MAG: ABC transporter permease [Alteromonadaceae bacterium]
MNVIDSLQEILFTLRHNRLRAFLTAFGVFWGIFMLIVLLGVGQGLQNGMKEGFTSNAMDSVWIFSRATSIPYKGLGEGRKITFNEADLQAVKDLPSVLYASAENPLGSTNGGDTLIRNGKLSGNFGVFGVADDYFKIKRYQDYQSGRRLNKLDDTQVRKVATIGTLVAKRLFPDQNPVGKSVQINDISFTIVGLFFDQERQGRNSERIYIPLSLYQKTFGHGDTDLKLITYQPKPGYDPYQVEKQVLSLLRKRHTVSPEDRNGIRSFNLINRAKRTTAMFRSINSFIWFVGIGTLVAGMVGISNIMMITVKERTVEIGVRKALGARPINIISALLFESILVTTFAGYLGLVVGVGVLELITFLMAVFDVSHDSFKRPEIDFNVAAWSIFAVVSAGALAGFAPAWRAARISPVEAMRSA